MSATPLRVVEGGRAPHGWEALCAKDVWRQGELPHGDLASSYSGEVFIHFERLGQPWLKEAAKRWARARLLGDTTPQTMSRYLTDLSHFSDWLAAYAPETVAPALLSREVLEDYLLWVRQQSGWKPATRNHRVVALRALLEEQARMALPGCRAARRSIAPSCRGLITACPSSSRARCSRSGLIRPISRCWMTSRTGRSCRCSRSPGFESRAW